MAYAYSTGLSADNRAILVSGLSGNVTVKFKLLVDMAAAPSVNYWYFFDGRYISGNSYLYGQNGTWFAPTNVTGLKVNGVSSTFQTGFKNSVTNDILEFTISSGSVGSGFCLFNRFNQTSEVLQNLQITDLQITDAAGVHSIVFPATGNTVADPLGTLTITIPNGTDSQWVYYADGSAITAVAISSIPTLSASAIASVTAPVFAASIVAGLPAPEAAAISIVAAPVFTADIAAGLPVPYASATAADSSPIFTAEISGGLPVPLAYAAANAFAPGNNAEISAGLPIPSASVVADSSVPVFGASILAGMPIPTASVVAVNAGTNNIAAVNAGLPVPTASANAIDTAPIFSATADAGLPVPLASATGTPESINSALINGGLPIPECAASVVISLPIYQAAISAGLPIPTAVAIASSGERIIFVEDDCFTEIAFESRFCELAEESRIVAL